MTINEYAKKAGITKIAKRLKLSHQTVWAWTVYRQCPRPEHMEQIFKLSRGRVTHIEMIRSFLKNHGKQNTKKYQRHH